MNFKTVNLKIHKIQIITFIAAKFQQTHPFNFTLNFTNITLIRTMKQLANHIKCNSLQKLFYICATLKTAVRPSDEFLRILKIS